MTTAKTATSKTATFDELLLKMRAANERTKGELAEARIYGELAKNDFEETHRKLFDAKADFTAARLAASEAEKELANASGEIEERKEDLLAADALLAAAESATKQWRALGDSANKELQCARVWIITALRWQIIQGGERDEANDLIERAKLTDAAYRSLADSTGAGVMGEKTT